MAETIREEIAENECEECPSRAQSEENICLAGYELGKCPAYYLKADYYCNHLSERLKEAVLSDEEMKAAIMEGIGKWQADMHFFWETDNSPYPENEEDYIRVAISQATVDKMLKMVK